MNNLIKSHADLNSIATYGTEIAALLRENKLKIACIEASSGGLISSMLLAQPGASRFFVSSCVCYSRKGIKQFLPAEVIEQSGAMNAKHNYQNKANYVESKEIFVAVIAEYLRSLHDCDYAIVESGTSGPDFYVPGVKVGFTAIGIASRAKTCVEVIETGLTDRELNMYNYAAFGIDYLTRIITENQSNKSKL